MTKQQRADKALDFIQAVGEANAYDVANHLGLIGTHTSQAATACLIGLVKAGRLTKHDSGTGRGTVYRPATGLEIHTHRCFTKAVLNGVTIARICPLADGTWQTSGSGVRSEVMTETAARGWLSAKTTAAALSIIL